MGMEVKEGIVLDREDGEGRNENVPPQGDVFSHAHARFNAQPGIRVFRGGWGLAAFLAVGIPLMLVAGMVIAGIALAAFTVFWLIRMLLGGPPSGPGRSVSHR